MAASSADIYKKMTKLISQANKYTPVNTSDIYSDLASRVNFFKPQYEELGKLTGEAYAAPATQMQDYYSKYGGDKALNGPSALSQLSGIMQDIGRKYGTMDALRGGISTQRGKLEDLANTINNQYSAGKQAIMDKYNMWSPLYSAALSREENAKNRAASRSSSGGIIYPSTTTKGTTTPKVDKTKVNLVSTIDKGMNDLKGGDNKVAPQTYSYFRTLWVDKGYDASAFDNEWGKYVNLSNPNLDDYFKPYTLNYSPYKK